MSGTFPPLYELTPDNLGGVVVVVSISLMATTLSVALIRAVVTHQQSARIQYDDVAYAIAVAFAVVLSSLYKKAVDHGLGRHMSALSKDDETRFLKAVYAAQIMTVACMSSAKVSVVFLFKRLTVSNTQGFQVALFFVILYIAFALPATIFQCMPEPWNTLPSRCSVHGKLMYAVIVLNMVTDAVLATGIIPTIWQLQVEKKKRLTVAGLFASRLFVCLVAIAQIVVVAKTLRSDDQSWLGRDRAILEQLVAHFSVLSATIPRTHNFWTSLHTGHADVRIPDSSNSRSKGTPKNSLKFGNINMSILRKNRKAAPSSTSDTVLMQTGTYADEEIAMLPYKSVNGSTCTKETGRGEEAEVWSGSQREDETEAGSSIRPGGVKGNKPHEEGQ